MDRRRGFKRLALALGIPYFAWWALIGYSGYRSLEYSQAKLASYNGSDAIDRGIYLQMNATANEDLANAFAYGVVLPIVVLVLFGVGFWVYRGFKPKS